VAGHVVAVGADRGDLRPRQRSRLAVVGRFGNGGCAGAPTASRTVFTVVPDGAPPPSSQARKLPSTVSSIGRDDAMQVE
jgi:hypothetical protein